MSSNDFFSLGQAFIGRGQNKQTDDLRAVAEAASRILELTQMPANGGDPLSVFRGDILRHVREIERLLQVDEKSINWAALVDGVKNNPDVDRFWDKETQTYRKNPSGGIDWMGNLKNKPAAKPEKKEKPGGVGSLFKL